MAGAMLARNAGGTSPLKELFEKVTVNVLQGGIDEMRVDGRLPSRSFDEPSILIVVKLSVIEGGKRVSMIPEKLLLLKLMIIEAHPV